jgi:hypothetical protein
LDLFQWLFFNLRHTVEDTYPGAATKQREQPEIHEIPITSISDRTDGPRTPSQDDRRGDGDGLAADVPREDFVDHGPVTSPIETAKLTVKVTSANRVTTPAPLGSVEPAPRAAFAMNWKAVLTTARLAPIPMNPASGRFRPWTVEPSNGDQGRQHVDAANRSGCHRRLQNLL